MSRTEDCVSFKSDERIGPMNARSMNMVETAVWCRLLGLRETRWLSSERRP